MKKDEMTSGNHTFTILLYHGVDAGEKFYEQRSNKEREYIITKAQFNNHLELFKRLGMQTPPLEQCLRQIQNNKFASRTLILSFDDGEESGYTTIAPLLEKYGFRGSYFIVAGWINKPGYMTEDQIRQLHKRGHGIYSHSMTHPFFTRISEAEIMSELRESKECLEKILGQEVKCFSLPTGEYDERFKELIAHSGYSYICTSREGYNRVMQKRQYPFLLHRFAIRNYTKLRDLKFIINARKITNLLLALKAITFFILKNIIGKDRYERIRSGIINNFYKD
ncbi:MAG: polysaccharide deacetylase family protein [Candidatus Omnitrophota bacterium]|nr:MAG: polysaccharide deacetylase family protein [Candidatus Omnitrophota bacterium]